MRILYNVLDSIQQQSSVFLPSALLLILYSIPLGAQFAVSEVSCPNIKYFSGVNFIDSKLGFAVGDSNSYGVIAKTNDGGTTWIKSLINFSDRIYNVSHIQFVDKSVGFAVARYSGGNLLLKTTNSGTSWDTVAKVSFAAISSMCFVDENLGYLTTTEDYNKIIKFTGTEYTPYVLGLKNKNNVLDHGYTYYKNPDKIGSSNPEATGNFIKSFDFITQWGDEDTDSAIFYMQKAIANDSLYAIAYASLGHMIFYEGYNGTTVDIDSIEHLAKRAIDIDPRCGDAQTLLARILVQKGEEDKALEACKKAVAVEPSHRETWFWLGMMYIPDKIDSAIYAFRKSLEIDSLFGQPHQKLGWIYLEDKPDYEKAACHFRQMIRLYEDIVPHDERMILGYYGLGETLIKMNRPEHAIDTFGLLLERCELSSILWLDKLKTWSYSGIFRCHIMLADTTIKQYISHSLSIPEKYPGDMGIRHYIVEELGSLADHLKKYDFNEPLKNTIIPLCEEIIGNSKEEYERVSAIYTKANFYQQENRFDEANTYLKRIAKDNHDILGFIYVLIARNYALSDNATKSLKYVKASLKEGFNELEWLKDEPAFEILRDNQRFIRIVNSSNTNQ